MSTSTKLIKNLSLSLGANAVILLLLSGITSSFHTGWRYVSFIIAFQIALPSIIKIVNRCTDINEEQSVINNMGEYLFYSSASIGLTYLFSIVIFEIGIGVISLFQ